MLSSAISDQLTAHTKCVTYIAEYQGDDFFVLWGCITHLYSCLSNSWNLVSFQIKAHQQEWVKTTEGVLKDLLAAQDKDTLQLLKEAAEQNKGEYWFSVVHTRS